MERMAGVLLNNTLFTRETIEVAIQATIGCMVCTACVTGRKGRVGKTFMHHELIGELILVLKPLLQSVLYSK